MKAKKHNKQSLQPEIEPGMIEHIRKRAYELWEASGSEPGNDVAHWTQADREVRAQLNRPASRAARH